MYKLIVTDTDAIEHISYVEDEETLQYLIDKALDKGRTWKYIADVAVFDSKESDEYKSGYSMGYCIGFSKAISNCRIKLKGEKDISYRQGRQDMADDIRKVINEY